MIAVKMRFLAGRFHATPWGHHVNEGAVEYPPSLWRFLRSLVATYYRTGADFDEASLKRILDALSDAPEFVLPSASVGHTRHYDQANSSVKFFDTFIALNPKDEIIWRWREADLDEADRENLKKLLRGLGTFGRSESWCEAELAESEIEDLQFNSFPVGGDDLLRGRETIRLLLPSEKGEDLLKNLLVDTSTMRGKQKQLEPNGSRWATYSREANLLTPRRLPPKRKSAERIITVARFALSANVLPLVTGSLPFAELARRALISNRRFHTEHSEVIAGKSADGVPLQNHRHAHYIPTDEDGDGRVDHLTVYAPRGFDKGDILALNRMSSINWRESRTGVRLILTGLGEAADFAAGENAVALFGKSTKFRSVTPFSLPNFPTRGGGKPARFKDTPEGQLRRELRRRGLPEPICVAPIKGYFPTLAPIENIIEASPRFRWLEFADRRFNGASGNGLAGFEIEFAAADADKIETPLALGFGCHFGLGLFLPVG